MQKLLLYGLTAFAAVCLTSTETVALPTAKDVRSSLGSRPTMQRVNVNSEKQLFSTLSDAADAQITLSPSVIEVGGDELMYIGAVRTVDGLSERYGVEVWDGQADPLTLPEGTYTFFAYGITKKSLGTIFIVKKDVEVTSSTLLNFSTADATRQINFKQLSPSGEVLTTNYDKDLSVSSAEDVITYDGEVAYWSGMDLYSEQMGYLRTNISENEYNLEFTRLYFCPSATDGMMFSINPVDFSKSNIGSTAEGWNIIDNTIVDTPAKIKDMEGWREEGMPEAEIPYTFIKYYITYDNEQYVSAGSGAIGAGYNAAKIGFWQPADYDGKFAHIVFPMGSVIAGDNSAIKAMPVTYRNGEGIIQLGLNPVLEPNFFFNADGKFFNNDNPFLTGKAVSSVIGNCTPALVTVPYGNQISFSYVGRHGEAFPIDDWNSSKYQNSIYFGQTNSIAVYFNGMSVSKDRNKYPDNIVWTQKGEYKIIYSTDNVLIDGEINGNVTGTLTYNTENYNYLVPTLTFMQFTNANGTITDRFSSAADATMTLYAATAKYNRTSTGSVTKRYVYYDLYEPADVKVEWAPTGTDEFSALTPVADKSKDFTPGFGSYYSVDMSDVTVEEGWIDVRITVTAESGAEQTQTITPAMFVSSTSGIANIVDDSQDAPVEYYNLQGIQIAQPQTGQLVIRRQAGKTVKIIAE